MSKAFFLFFVELLIFYIVSLASGTPGNCELPVSGTMESRKFSVIWSVGHRKSRNIFSGGKITGVRDTEESLFSSDRDTGESQIASVPDTGK